jgi:uncharacterized membrane protein
MRDEGSQLERFGNGVTAAGVSIALLTSLAVSVALLVMGNTLARLIGLMVFAVSLLVVARAMRRRLGKP